MNTRPDTAVRHIRPRLCLFLVLLPILLAVVCSAAGNPDPRSLVQERCLGCHGLDKICQVETNDQNWWNGTVQRMVEYKSGLLTADEEGAVGSFLARREGRTGLCATR